MIRKDIIHVLALLVIAGSGLAAVPTAYAQSTPPPQHMNFFQEFIQFISQKFGLDKTQVQNAVTDFQNQKRASMAPRPTLSPDQIAAREKIRLDQYVKEGKITVDQEKAIIDELQVIRSKYRLDNLRNITPDQRHTQMQAMRDELINWAKTNGIDSSYILPGMMGRGMGMGMEMKGRGWGKYGNNSNAPVQNQ